MRDLFRNQPGEPTMRSHSGDDQGAHSDAIVEISLAGGGFRVARRIAGRDYSDFWRRMQDGAWEPETLWLLDRLLTPGVEFYDIGAWIGPTTLFASMKGVRVVAFEPDPVARKALATNLALNPTAGSVSVRPYALAAARGKASLFG